MPLGQTTVIAAVVSEIAGAVAHHVFDADQTDTKFVKLIATGVTALVVAPTTIDVPGAIGSMVVGALQALDNNPEKPFNWVSGTNFAGELIPLPSST